jgi:hypothetical protein
MSGFTRARERRNQSGQSTIEFALTMTLLFAFVLFFFQLGLVFAFGNYTHYITFMSARAYMAAGADQEDQTSRAQDVISRTLKGGAGQGGADRFPFIAQGVGGGGAYPGLSIGPGPEFQLGDRESSWEQGVRYTFRSRLFLIPLTGAGTGSSASANSIQLTSESWLGREPADDDCTTQLSGKGIFDNGC